MAGLSVTERPLPFCPRRRTSVREPEGEWGEARVEERADHSITRDFEKECREPGPLYTCRR